MVTLKSSIWCLLSPPNTHTQSYYHHYGSPGWHIIPLFLALDGSFVTMERILNDVFLEERNELYCIPFSLATQYIYFKFLTMLLVLISTGLNSTVLAATNIMRSLLLKGQLHSSSLPCLLTVRRENCISCLDFKMVKWSGAILDGRLPVVEKL